MNQGKENIEKTLVNLDNLHLGSSTHSKLQSNADPFADAFNN